MTPAEMLLLAWDRLWKRADVARYLGIHPRTTLQHPTLQRLAVHLTQRTIRFDPFAVKRWAEDHDWDHRKWRRSAAAKQR